MNNNYIYKKNLINLKYEEIKEEKLENNENNKNNNEIYNISNKNKKKNYTQRINYKNKIPKKLNRKDKHINKNNILIIRKQTSEEEEKLAQKNISISIISQNDNKEKEKKYNNNNNNQKKLEKYLKISSNKRIDFIKREKPKISLIITVYNQENFLRYCYASIQKQKLKDIEIIFIDDASEDNSSKIIHELMKKLGQIMKIK